jgi:glycosidase
MNLKGHMKEKFQGRVSALLSGLCAVFLFQSAFAQTSATVRTAPAWLRDGVVYEVFPRDFSKEGNLNGVTARLGQLEELGVTILWLMPIHPIGKEHRKGSYGSPYAAQDYYAINPDYGTADDLKRLVSEAHERKMKVILDIVLLHTAWDSVLMAHPEFYKHDAAGKIVPPMPEWDDVAGLNYQNPRLRQYMIAMLQYWIKSFDLDGFRCDTASMLPTRFWEEARVELAKVKPDIMMLAEADKPELLTHAFDIDYAWPMMNTVRSVVGGSAPASEIRRTWENDLKRYPRGALHLNMSDNHDQRRLVASFGVPGALAASALMFTLDGVPLLYNGMEVGDTSASGDPALFEKVPIAWQSRSDPPVSDTYRDLIKLRKQYPAFRSENVEWVQNTDSADMTTYLRADGTDEFLVAINFSKHPIHGTVDVRRSEDFLPVKIAGIENSDSSSLSDLHLNAFEWRIYHRGAALAAGK